MREYFENLKETILGKKWWMYVIGFFVFYITIPVVLIYSFSKWLKSGDSMKTNANKIKIILFIAVISIFSFLLMDFMSYSIEQDEIKNEQIKAEKDAIKQAEKDAIKQAELDAIKLAEEQAIKQAELDAIKLAEEQAIKQAELDAIKLAEEQAKIEEQKKVSVNSKKNNSKPKEVYYKNCTAVKNAGKDPIYEGQPGYANHLDRDGDGIACEK